jgi:hypothetical protein
MEESGCEAVFAWSGEMPFGGGCGGFCGRRTYRTLSPDDRAEEDFYQRLRERSATTFGGHMVLRLLTAANKELVKELASGSNAEEIDLTREDVNYHEVLEKIFEADSIQVF